MNKFRIYILSLTVGEMPAIRTRIIDECAINNEKYNNWLMGRTAVPPLAQKVIEEIAGKTIFTEE